MSLFVLTCPHCGFSKEVVASVLPAMGTNTTCPRCRESFPLHPECLKGGDGPSPFSLSSPAGHPFCAQKAEPEPWVSDQPALSSPPPKTLTFTFTGNAREYFGIWIVNTLLRIVTLGLYSPWAKVRKRRYFYGNTLLDDSPFDYLADPLAILKGWLIAVAFFGCYSVASQVNPIAAAVLMVISMGVFPWVVVRSRLFNLRNSSHRNIRFRFAPNYKEAYRVFLWWQLLIPLTLGILTPYVLYRQKRFLAENSFYGTTPFSFHATSKQYFRIFTPMFILVPLMVASFAGIFHLAPQVSANPLLALLPLATMLGIYFVVGLYLPTALTNLTWNSTGISDHRFVSTLRVRDLLWIHFSSAVAVILSLGMLMPWASVRLVRYRLGRLTMSGVGDLDSITAAAAETTGATGEELGEVFGFDLGM